MRFLPGKGFVYRLAMDATRQGDDVAGWKSGACSGISSRHSIKGSSEPFASSARVFSGFCLSFVQFLNNSCSRNKNFSPLMPINCLVNCPINRRVKETKRGRDKKTKRRRDEETKGEGPFFETLMFMNYSRIDHELILGTWLFRN